MNDKFSKIHEGSNLGKLWEKCTFVFDIDILITLYTYPEEIHDEFISIVENEIHNRVWIPPQISLEPQQNGVPNVRAVKNYEELKNTINSLRDDSKDLAQKITDLNDTFFSSLKMDHSIEENFSEIDTFLENMSISLEKINKLNSLFNEKTEYNCLNSGSRGSYNETKIRDINIIHRGLEENKYPILWYRMLDYAKEEQKDIIFITEDPKWQIKQENELTNAYQSLLKEFSSIGQEFCVYSLKDFLRHSKKYLNLKSNGIEAVIEELTELSNKLKENRNTEIETFSSDITLQEMINNKLLGESALQKLINQKTAYEVIQELISQDRISESELQQIIDETLIEESALQQLINQNTAYGALQKLIHQKAISGIALQKMITQTIMGDNILQKLIDENTATKNALKEALQKRNTKN